MPEFFFIKALKRFSPTISRSPELDRFVSTKIKSGRYEDASEVVRAGLRKLEREEQVLAAKLAALRQAIDEGDASGVARGNVFDRVPRVSPKTM